MPSTLVFYALAVLAITSALYVVLTDRPSYGVLSLVVTMFALSGLFILLQAYFVAVIQILIYAGAILVLFLFILMLIGMEGITEPFRSRKPIVTILLTYLFLTGILDLLFAAKGFFGNHAEMVGTIETLGRVLFTNHLLAFEMVSFVLLVGAIGVISISRKEENQ